MAAKDAAIIMKFINDDIFKILKKLDPLGMVGENARVQHVGIGNNDMTLATYSSPGILRRISIIGKYFDTSPGHLNCFIQFSKLVLRKSLGRKR